MLVGRQKMGTARKRGGEPGELGGRDRWRKGRKWAPLERGEESRESWVVENAGEEEENGHRSKEDRTEGKRQKTGIEVEVIKSK